MNILFLTYHGFDPGSGISKKMQAQIKGLRQNGHEVHVCSYSYATNGHLCRFIDDKVLKDYGRGNKAALCQRMSYGCIADYCLSSHIELVYSRNYQNASPQLVALFKKLKRHGVHCVQEIPTYPYDGEFKGYPWDKRLGLAVDKMFRKALARQMDAVVTFSDVKEIFGQRTINISNGVDFDTIPLHHYDGSGGDDIHVIAVAEVHTWHGFDRFIHGLGEYYRQFTVHSSQFTVHSSQFTVHSSQFTVQSPQFTVHSSQSTVQSSKSTGHRKVYFHIVGDVWDPEMYGSGRAPGFATYINKYGIGQYVIFHGKLFGEELDKVFNHCVFAVGSLGRHRSGITHIKTLKNREYACRGIPFVYSECDSDFDHQPYVLKVPADESPIDIRKVLDFIDAFNMKPEDIRKSVEHLSWKKQMQSVIEQL